MPQLFLFIMLLTGTLSVTAQSYGLKDLEFLAQEGSYDEFFRHALDIRPSERQEQWKSMVLKMADSYTRSMLNKSRPELKDFRWLETHYRWPLLKSDDVFKMRRQELGLKYIKSCLKEEKPCWDELKKFWETDRENGETSYKIAEMLVEIPNSPFSTWDFLEVALKTPLSEFYCKKDFVLDSLWSKLELDYIRLGPKGDLLKKIDQTVHYDCLPSLNSLARQRLISPLKSKDRELAYQILNAQGKTDQKTKDFFLTVYLLETPSQGELFNYSWNRLKELAKSPNRRDEVLLMLKSQDPLPDELFTSMDQIKKRAILQLFKTHFPEYLDFYSSQCVKFYSGKAVFPEGNPTMHCQDLMKSNLAPQFIDPKKIQAFEQGRKI